MTYVAKKEPLGALTIQDAFLFEMIPDLWHHGGIGKAVRSGF